MTILPDSGTILSSISETTASDIDVCDFASGRRDIWFRVEGTGDDLIASTCSDGTTFDSIIEIVESIDGTCTTLSCVSSNDDAQGCDSKSKVRWSSSVGTTYFVRVLGFTPTTSGDFELAITTSMATMD